MSLQFLYPNWLWALLLIALPIIIHLFNFRKFKLVYFTNVHLLENIKKETKSKSRIKEWLILMSRILFIIFLVLAFAQPVLIDDSKSDLAKTDYEVVILIDNSFSMSAEGLSGIQIEFAKRKALEILEAYPPQTSFMLVSSEAKRSDMFFRSKDELFTAISQLKTSAFAKTLDQAYLGIENVLESDLQAERHYYILSDYQKKDFKQVAFNSDKHRYFFVSLPVKPSSNVYIDTVFFLSPIHSAFEDERLVYRLQNTSESSLPDFPVELFLNDSLKSISTVDLPPQGSVYDTIVYKNSSSGYTYCELRINDLPVTFDNKMFFGYKVKNQIDVAILSEAKENNYLKAFFENNDFFKARFYNPSSLDLAVWNQADVLILNQINQWPQGLEEQTKSLVEEGASLIVFPSNQFMDYSAFNLNYIKADTSFQQLSKINYASDLLKKAFVKKEKQISLPEVVSNYILNDNYNWLLKNKKGQALAVSSKMSLGEVLAFTAPANSDNTALYTHPVFIPIMYNFMTLAEVEPVFYQTGERKTIVQVVKDSNRDQVAHIASSGVDIIPEQYKSSGQLKYFLPKQLDAGQYQLKYNNTLLSGLSVNYQRKESISDFFEMDKMILKDNQTLLNIEKFDSKSISQSIDASISLWIYLLYVSIFFIFIEILLIKMWRKA
jgi:hypothetical protein